MIGFAAALYATLALFAALFQLALVLGAPWGSLALGGRWQGKLPPLIRVYALVQGGVLVVMAGVVCGRAGLGVPAWGAGWLFWPVLALTAVSLVANLTTPSRPERWIWAPVTAVMLAAAGAVALLG